MRRILLISAIAAVSLIYAETPPAFDAASVKPIVPKDNAASRTSYGEFMGSLQFLIRQAYGVDDYRIAGGPKWIDGDRFSITYKPVGPQANLMLRTLLAERFKLAVHMESRQLPIYSLIVARNGSKAIGPKMQKATDTGSGMSSGPAMIRGTMEMSVLATQLSSTLRRGVIDQTGLTGPYTFSLKWTPDDRPASPDNAAPSLFTAIQEQLGLRLESTKGPVEVLVIDHAEKPAEN